MTTPHECKVCVRRRIQKKKDMSEAKCCFCFPHKLCELTNKSLFKCPHLPKVCSRVITRRPAIDVVNVHFNCCLCHPHDGCELNQKRTAGEGLSFPGAGEVRDVFKGLRDSLAKPAEPAPSVGWEDELSDLLAHLERAVRNGNQTLSSEIMVKEFFIQALREAGDSAYLKAQGEYRDMLAFSHRCDLLHGFDEAVNIAGYGTREVQAKLHEKRRELEKN